MKCPFCEKELPGTPCASCGALNPEDAAYCMACGDSLQTDESFEPTGDDDLDFDSRELCADGSCTGIIVEGRCTECGRTPEEAEQAARESAEEAAQAARESAEEAAQAARESAEETDQTTRETAQEAEPASEEHPEAEKKEDATVA